MGEDLSFRLGISFQTFCAFVVAPYYHTAYRIRGWGGLPRKRRPMLLIANHQHDLDPNAAIIRLALQGPWKQTIYAASSRRMFEPGFMGIRIPWLERWLGTLDASKLFKALGLLPIENELFARSLSSIAWYVHSKHGDLPIAAVFRSDVVERFGAPAAGKTLAWLFTGAAFVRARKTRVGMNAVLQPFRSELLAQARADIAADLRRIEDVVRAGATFYLTPEGRYTTDGRVGRFRQAFRRLAPLAPVFLIAMSYDVFAAGRLSILFRVMPPADAADLRTSLIAARPITLSQLLAAWLAEHGRQFTAAEALEQVRGAVSDLPASAFVDPEIRRSPKRLVNGALRAMLRLQTLQRENGAYSLTPNRRHPQFPQVKDMLAYQAAFFTETLHALHALAN